VEKEMGRVKHEKEESKAAIASCWTHPPSSHHWMDGWRGTVVAEVLVWVQVGAVLEAAAAAAGGAALKIGQKFK
jgi:hypothetical protein